MQEPLFKIHETTHIEQKYMILLGLFVKVIIFQHLRKYKRATAVNFDKYDVIKTLEEVALRKIHEITRVQLKYMILGGLFIKVIIFRLLREYRRATAVNFDKYDVMKIYKTTFVQNT